MRVTLNLRNVCRGVLLSVASMGMAVGPQSMAADITYNTNTTWDSLNLPAAASNNIKLNGASGVPTTLTIDGITAPTSGTYSSFYTAATTAYEANLVVQNGAKYFSGASYIGDKASSISHLTVSGSGSEWTSGLMQIARQSNSFARSEPWN